MAFQLVRLELNEAGAVVSRKPTQPLFELRDHAMAMAEFDAARCYGEYGYDGDRDCWWARDSRCRLFRFVVEPIAVDVAA